jgi:hypothetical protein
MNRLTLTLATLCCASILWPVYGTTLFSDDFSDTNASLRNWPPPANCSITFSGGAATFINKDTTYGGFFTHVLQSPKPAKFTLSAKFTSTAPFNGAGFAFCLNMSTVSGYSLELGGSQDISVYKYVSGAGTPLISSKTSSFINTLSNTITVSKSSDTFNIFANGQYVTRFNDVQFGSGDIGIVVPPKSQVAVDNLVLTDQFTEGSASTCFADSFKSTDLGSDGWNTTPLMGQATVGAGRCILNNTDTLFSSIIFTDGNFQSASIKAAVGSPAGKGMYGVCFVSVVTGDSGQVAYKPYAFLIDSLRRYSIVYPDSATSWTRPVQSFINGGLGTDTLEVIRYAKHFAFRVNGYDVGETIPVPDSFRIDGSGLYVSPKTSSTYDYFIVGGDSTGAVCTSVASVISRSILNRTTLPQFGATSVVYDLMGRKIGALNRVTFSTLLSGPYIVVTRSPGGSLMKAVRVMKLPK